MFVSNDSRWVEEFVLTCSFSSMRLLLLLVCSVLLLSSYVLGDYPLSHQRDVFEYEIQEDGIALLSPAGVAGRQASRLFLIPPTTLIDRVLVAVGLNKGSYTHQLHHLPVMHCKAAQLHALPQRPLHYFFADWSVV